MIPIRDSISKSMRLLMRFMTLPNLLCTKSTQLRIRNSLANQKTCISGAIQGDLKQSLSIIVSSISRAICDVGFRVSETKSKILLEATGVHDKRSHLLLTMHAAGGCCARGVGGFKSNLSGNSSDSADDTSGFPSFDPRLCTHVRIRRR
jgi:hypothetical protein